MDRHKTRVRKYLKWTKANDNDVCMRVFLPALKDEDDEKKKRPAIVMVCGLLWFGEGLLGAIGNMFNDGFGWAMARAGVPCVQLHTPQRHIGYTRLMDYLAVLLFPLTAFNPLRTLIPLVDVFMIATDFFDLLPLFALVMVFERWGWWALPFAHLATRNLQWIRGSVPGPPRRDHQADIAAAVAWTQENKELLGSDGRLVLAGYSSGGHCAALFGVAEKAPKFEAVVLISGIYSVMTDAWVGGRRLLAPLFNIIYGDILGCRTSEARRELSPEVRVERKMNGQDWYVLTAKYELMGMQPFQDILFRAEPLCDALKAKGAKVHRVSCGLNHWTLVFSFKEFANTFCRSLIK